MNQALLEVRNLSKRFGGLVAVNSLSFSVDKGEIVGLIGPNGAGKTTAFNLISGTLVPSEGSILFAGSSVTGGPASKSVVAGLVRTFQSAATYPDVSVKKNIYRGILSRIKGSLVSRLVGRVTNTVTYQDVETEIDAILKVTDLYDWSESAAGMLPYGLQKKLGIAIALASKPTMLLLDEPAAGLNHEECRSLAHLLRKLQETEGLTLLLVEHHMEMVMELCDRIVVLVQGQKIAEGTPNEIRQNPEVIEAYLGAPDYAHA